MPVKVWYLDDESGLCENFFDEFNSEEFKVTVFLDPQQFIEQIKNGPPDLIFIDYRLPSTNGDKIAQNLGLTIPIYLITGEVSVITEYKFTRVLKKPYSPNAVQEILRNFKNL
jgi:DNA-binding NtrC family response regulator